MRKGVFQDGGQEGQREFDGDSVKKMECQLCIEPGKTAAASQILFHFGDPLKRKETVSICTRLYFGEIHSKDTFV